MNLVRLLGNGSSIEDFIASILNIETDPIPCVDIDNFHLLTL